jgi:hypothetical protein
MQPGDVYRHYIGSDYRIIGLFTWEDTGESCVLYESVKDGKRWGRTIKQFTEKVVHPATWEKVPRFSLIPSQ